MPRSIKLLLLLLAAMMNLLITACGPLAVVGAVGNVVNRTIQRKQDANVENDQQYMTDTRPDTPDTGEIATANLNVGVEYMRQGDYEKALSRLERARDADPDYAPVYDMLGLLYQRMEQPLDAEKNFKRALKLNKNYSGTLNNYAQFLCQQGRVEEAEKNFRKVTSDPFYVAPEVAYTNLGTCVYKQGRVEEAESYFDKALSLNPEVPTALLQIAEIQYNRENYNAAGAYLDRFNKLSQPSPRSLWLGIRIKNELGDRDSVSSYALLLRNQYPESDEAQLLRDSGIK